MSSFVFTISVQLELANCEHDVWQSRGAVPQLIRGLSPPASAHSFGTALCPFPSLQCIMSCGSRWLKAHCLARGRTLKASCHELHQAHGCGGLHSGWFQCLSVAQLSRFAVLACVGATPIRRAQRSVYMRHLSDTTSRFVDTRRRFACAVQYRSIVSQTPKSVAMRQP